MGQAIAAARASIKEADEAQVKVMEEKIHILEQLVESKLDKFEAELQQQFLNPEAVSKTSVPGKRALRWERYSTIDITDKPAEGIQNAVESFFGKKAESGSGGKSESKEIDIAGGFKSIVTTALSAFLGNGTIGEHTEEKYFVCFMHNAIVRVDIKLWRWNFKGFGISDTQKAVLGYIYCMSVVDISVLTTNEFVFLISEFAGDDDKACADYIEKMKTLYKEARNLSGLTSTPTSPKIKTSA